MTDELGRICMRFRSNRDPLHRQQMTEDYAKEVKRLIATGKWDWYDYPALEDMLPHDNMPKEFFEYWKNK